MINNYVQLYVLDNRLILLSNVLHRSVNRLPMIIQKFVMKCMMHVKMRVHPGH
ncbi:hypothetical protein BLA29_015146 [Euroglyphus maynei]|uniref:Uncharacterized protein n=1 Tax=Euroglyphus maynei TaxID=6958 RepID=A0A1Y3BRW5_EURMA|nr:hypothetical protein BLA29_015146 [Euroglyphus maynei]